jgi:hypothetical protein
MLIWIVLVTNAFTTGLERISLVMKSETVQKGKKITVIADVYYQKTSGLMVTHFIKPFENISITDNKGSMKVYDPKINSVMQMNGLSYSSDNSLFYYFVSNKTDDMGLKNMGFKLAATKLDNKMVVSTWLASLNTGAIVTKAEVVHQNYKPIFLVFFNKNNKPVSKTYYSNYQKVGDILLPFTVTEIQYSAISNDSVIQRKIYSNAMVDMQVNDQLLNYKIPANATIVSPNAKK